MKRVTISFFFILASAAVAMSQTAAEWIKYTSPEGRYSVLLPTQPKLSNQDTTASTGEKLPQYMASVIDGNGVFMIGYFDYAADQVFSIEKARDGMVESMKGTLQGDEVVSLGKAPGRSIKLLAKAEAGEEFLDRAIFYDVNRRIYVLQCIFPKGEDGPAVAEKCQKFASSFKASEQ